MKYRLVILLQILSFVYRGSSFDTNVVNNIDRVIQEKFIPFHNITGLGLSIIKLNDNGSTDSLSKGYGWRDMENRLRVDEYTKFSIGSITKSFTATIVVKALVEKYPELGELVLDVPIRQLIPELNFTLSDRYRSESVSFRDLLSHRTCLEAVDVDFGNIKDKDELFFRHRYAAEVCPFRTNFVYNNGAYFLASEVIAMISNTTFEEMLNTLLKDIGMIDSLLIQDYLDLDSLQNFTKSYFQQDGKIKLYNSSLLKSVSIMIGAGGIISTPGDMFKYMMFHLNNGRVGSKQIVPQATLKYLARNTFPISSNLGKRTSGDKVTGALGYGLGFFTGLTDGWETIQHGGYLPPHHSLLSLYPSLNFGVFTTTNGPGVVGHNSLHEQIFEIIQNAGAAYEIPKNRDYYAFNSISTIPLPKRKVNQQSLVVNRVEANDIIGIYGNGLSGEFTVDCIGSSSEENLYIRYGSLGTGYLKRRSNTSFVVDLDSDLKQKLYTYNTPKMIEIVFDFKENDSAYMSFDFWATDYSSRSILFKRNLTLAQLPSRLWNSNTCGPTF